MGEGERGKGRSKGEGEREKGRSKGAGERRKKNTRDFVIIPSLSIWFWDVGYSKLAESFV
jgi:hypothetical protein